MTYDNSDWFNILQDHGYSGIQTADRKYAEMALRHGLSVATDPGKKIEAVGDIYEAVQWAADFAVAMTAHVGNGFETDDYAFRLFEDVLNCSEKHNLPVYPETHRATLLQDPYRSLRILEKFPELRLNGDFSHWYTGSEMIYGDFDEIVSRLEPALLRVRFIHGRISNTGHIQIKVQDKDDNNTPVEHFRTFWRKSFVGFIQHSETDPPWSFGKYPSEKERIFYFAPELLRPEINYAYCVLQPDGTIDEETDRWLQANILCDIAEDCFADCI